MAGGAVVNSSWDSKDASKTLCTELLAAKLNCVAGAKHNCVDLIVAQAEAFLRAHPYGSNPQGAERVLAFVLKAGLEAFNNLGCL